VLLHDETFPVFSSVGRSEPDCFRCDVLMEHWARVIVNSAGSAISNQRISRPPPQKAHASNSTVQANLRPTALPGPSKNAFRPEELQSEIAIGRGPRNPTSKGARAPCADSAAPMELSRVEAVSFAVRNRTGKAIEPPSILGSLGSIAVGNISAWYIIGGGGAVWCLLCTRACPQHGEQAV
jgi:hypothetical protein